MGRPLKIKKSTTGDIGFNAFDQLAAPALPVDFNATQYEGVVGGANANVATATYPVVKCRAYITGTAAEDDAYIITQKGSTKYQVATVSAINDEDMVPGKAYRILTVGDTNWSAVGATRANPAVGDIFTATAVGAGNGTVQAVGICVLADEADGALTEGNMNITMSVGDSAATTIARLTNKYALDYSDNRYAVNFFTDGGTVIKSGTAGSTLTLAAVEKFTS